MVNKFKLLIVLVVVCCIIYLTLFKIKNETPINKMKFRKDKSFCPKGVVTVVDGGRLCHKILEYVSVWALSRSYGLVPYVPNAIHSALKDVFTHLKIPPLSKLVHSSANCSKINSKILKKSNYYFTDLNETAIKTKQSEEPLILRQYTVLIESIVPLIRELKKEFKYKSKHLNVAQVRLHRARASMNNKYGNREIISYGEVMLYLSSHGGILQTLFVGVHVRRGDYIGYLKSGGVTTTADTSYYRHAMAWMLRKLSSDSASSRNIAFILASDDEVWCKKKLIPEIKKDIRLLGNQTKLGGSNVFYLGIKTTPVVDLVMLSSCNHSIIAYGTYGIWSALMANGWTVVYDMAAKNKPKAVKKMNAPMEFSKHLHNWVKLL